MNEASQQQIANDEVRSLGARGRPDAPGLAERRRMIRASLASVPLVLTVWAGRANAQQTTSYIPTYQSVN